MPIAHGAGLMGHLECAQNRVPIDNTSIGRASKALPADGKLQFKAPFVENLFASRHASRKDEDSSHPNSHSKDDNAPAPNSKLINEINSQNNSIRVEENDNICRAPLDLASNHFLSEQSKTES